MKSSPFLSRLLLLIVAVLCAESTLLTQNVMAQSPPYENVLPVQPPYYRVRYDGSMKPGELVFPASFTIWIPAEVSTLRGVIVHQHGCGEGSCKSGQTGAFDLHWQALAQKHECALISPVYEQPEKANCQLWCDPRNGSDVAFQKSLVDLAKLSNHPELPSVPWALWGHSGGGHWVGGMAFLHPDRVAAAWLRSGVPPLKSGEGKPPAYEISEAVCQVPLMCNLGTKEGVTDKAGRFAGVWPGVQSFYQSVRAKGGLIAVSVDPLSSHDCGNQRYLAIPWLDACLTARLPENRSDKLKAMPQSEAWIAAWESDGIPLSEPMPAAKFTGSLEKSVWLPNESIAKAWLQYSKDSVVVDTSLPPAPANLKVNGNLLTWTAAADLESGLSHFIIERDGKFLTNVPDKGKNPFGRPIFQNLSYSDTPTQPLVEMRFMDTNAEQGKTHQYKVIAVNTAGLKSK